VSGVAVSEENARMNAIHPASISAALVLAAPGFALAFVPAGVTLPPSAHGTAPRPVAQEAQDDGPVRLQEGQAAITLKIVVGRSRHLTTPWPAKGASLTDPAVADVQVLTPQLLQVSGKAPGTTDVVVWGENGRTLHARVEVDADLERLRVELAAVLSDASLRLSQQGGVVVVSGVLARAEQSQALHRYLEASGVDYVDVTRLAGVQQVQVQVRVAEVSRTAIRALGVNALKGGDDFFGGQVIGSADGGPLNPISIGPQQGASALGNLPFDFTSDTSVTPAITLFAGFPKSDLEIFVQALAENQYLRVLAEPNLVALSGEQASFLAGGEFPIPIVQGGAVGNAITIEYKEFGVGLKFRPLVLGEGAIRLQVASEVSELSDIGALVIEGFRIPAIITRKTETTLELHSGETFAMAGLISESTNAQASRVPGLGDLPVLGSLFRSVRYRSGETELLVLVTASVTEPLGPGGMPPLPGETHVVPDEWELFGEGRIEGRAPAAPDATQAVWLRETGLDRLRGPGAWATHEQGPARSRARILPKPPPPPEPPPEEPVGVGIGP
jgi:pilus assembly protein CpaC